MRLVSAAAERKLVEKVRAAYAKMTKAALSADVLGVTYAAAAVVDPDPTRESSSLTTAAVRKLLRAGVVSVDREVVEQAEKRLADAAKAIRDRLTAKIKNAIADGSSVLRRQKTVGKQKMGEVRKAVVARLGELVETAISESQRDWTFAVDYAVHEVTEEAAATNIVKAFGDDPLVWKQVNPDCCDYCRIFYTTDGTTPRVFNLSTLVANGSNIGRKAGRPSLEGENATEWKPVLGSTHVRCRCRLRGLPSGAVFNKEGKLTYEEAVVGRRTG